MSTTIHKFQSYGAYARSVARRSSRPRTHSSINVSSRLPRHVLIVEFRDEIYASISRVLEDEGLTVSRAEKASEVAAKASGTSRDIVLINEAMPDESGWLISSKLHLSKTQRRLWMYTAKRMVRVQKWKKLAGVECVISYGGDLVRLVRALQAQIKREHQFQQEKLALNAVHTVIHEAFSNNAAGMSVLVSRFAG
jgi:DNA-binding response OmpR family regulator